MELICFSLIEKLGDDILHFLTHLCATLLCFCASRCAISSSVSSFVSTSADGMFGLSNTRGTPSGDTMKSGGMKTFLVKLCATNKDCCAVWPLAFTLST